MSLTSYEFSRIKLVEGKEYYIVKMDRPEVKNAIDPDMLDEIDLVVKKAEEEGKYGVVISSTSHEYFSSGGDLKYFLSLDDYQKGYEMARYYGEKLSGWQKRALLIIAAVEGYAIGGGAELTLAADMRIAGSDAVFQFKQVKLGLITGWGGATRLDKIVGPSRALYLLTTGAPVNSRFAHEIGLVDFLVGVNETEKRAVEIISSLSGSDRDAIRYYKQIIYDYSSRTPEKAFLLERKLFAELWDSPRHREMEKQFFSDKKE